MQWIKARLSLVITGAVALIAIGLMVWGALDTSVKAYLEQHSTLPQSVQSAGVANTRTIQAIRDQIEANRKIADTLARNVSRLSDHKLLRTDVFPTITSDVAPFNFQREYKEQYRQLLNLMRATDAPTQDEVTLEDRRMEAARKKAEEMRSQGTTDPRGFGGGPGPLAITPNPAAAAANRDLSPDKMTIEEQARELAAARVAIMKARKGYCYANESSFDGRPNVLEVPRPGLEDMWYAQVSLWIQEDLLGALAKLNEQAAEKLPEEQRWLGHLPFKHLVSTHVKGYVPSAAGGAAAGGPGGFGGAPMGGSEPGAGILPAFTQHTTTPGSVDVIQVTLNLVIDARELPAILDAICRAGFYTPLNVDYVAIPPSHVISGYVYGPAPVINVTLDLEGSFLRDEKINALMPKTVVDAIAAGQAVGAGAAPAANPLQRDTGMMYNMPSTPMPSPGTGMRTTMPPGMNRGGGS